MNTQTSNSDSLNLVYEAVQGEQNLTAEILWRIPRVGAPCVSSDATRLVVPVTTWPGEKRKKLTRLWLMAADGSACRPITGEATNTAIPIWSPDDRYIAYASSPRGESQSPPQLWLLSLEGGEPEPLTDLPLGVLDARWLPDGSGLIIASNLITGHATIDETRTELQRREDDPVSVHATEQRLFRFWDQWLTDEEKPHFFHLDLATRECRHLTPGFEFWLQFMNPAGQFDIAPDGSEIVFAGITVNENRNDVDTRIFRVAITGGDVECLTPEAPANSVRPRYSPDGSTIVYGRTEDRYFYADRARLYRYDRSTGKHEAWCDEWDQDPGEWEFANDGSLILTAGAAARTHLYRLGAEERKPRLIAQGGAIGPPVLASDGSIYFQMHSLQTPTEIHRLGAGSQKVERLTQFTSDAMTGVSLGEVKELECAGPSGESFQTFVIFPTDHDFDSPAPFINVIHGGPHGVWGDEFHYRWNAHAFAAAGYVVSLINYQGSTTWGNDFSQRIQGEWGKRPFEDIMAATDRLIELGVVDSNQMAAAGGSYGGYMAAWIAGHTDRFRCIVNHAGVYNTLSMWASDATWGRGRSFGGEPWDGIEAIDQYNPARFTRDMKTPMLVIHGEKDYRVPVTQGLECYGILQAKRIPSRLVYFPDENHWILKPDNSMRWYQEVLDWIDRWVKDDSAN